MKIFLMKMTRGILFGNIIVLAMLGLLEPVSRISAMHASATYTIAIQGASVFSGFSPDYLSAHVGDTITFVNEDPQQKTHRIVAQDTLFTSPDLTFGKNWSFHPSTTGFIGFTDANDATMIGTIWVANQSAIFLPDIEKHVQPATTWPWGLLIGGFLACGIILIVLFVMRRYVQKDTTLPIVSALINSGFSFPGKHKLSDSQDGSRVDEH